MSLLVEAGTFTSPATASPSNPYTYTLNSFGDHAPKCLILWGGGITQDTISSTAIASFGFATSSSNRAVLTCRSNHNISPSYTRRRHDNTNCYAMLQSDATILEEADLNSFNAGNFQLDWGASAVTPYAINYLALDGDDLEANIVEFSGKGSTGPQSIQHGLAGGSPTALIILGVDNVSPPSTNNHAFFGLGFWGANGNKEISSCFGSINNKSTSESAREQAPQIINGITEGWSTRDNANITSVDQTNVILNWNNAGSALNYYMLALRGPQFSVGTFNTPISGKRQTVRGIDFEPKGILLTSFMGASSTNVQDDARLMIGADTGRHNGAACAGCMDEDNVNPTDTDRFHNSSRSIHIIDHTQTTRCQGRLSMLDSGFQVYYDSVNSSISYEIGYLAIGEQKENVGAFGRNDRRIIV